VEKREQLGVVGDPVPLWRGPLDRFEGVERQQEIEMGVHRLTTDTRSPAEFGLCELGARQPVPGSASSSASGRPPKPATGQLNRILERTDS
jgi:hypothetical protein